MFAKGLPLALFELILKFHDQQFDEANNNQQDFLAGSVYELFGQKRQTVRISETS